jgi:hypothetical protein
LALLNHAIVLLKKSFTLVKGVLLAINLNILLQSKEKKIKAGKLKKKLGFFLSDPKEES